MIRERFTKLLAQTDSKGTTQSACGGAFQVEGVARLPVLRQVCLPRVGDIHPVRRRGKERLQMKLRYGEQNLKALQPTKKTLPFTSNEIGIYLLILNSPNRQYLVTSYEVPDIAQVRGNML